MVANLKKHWKENLGKPTQLAEEEWALWCSYWSLPLTEDIAYKNSQNRATQSEGGGVATHHLGARSTTIEHYMGVIIYVFFSI